MPIDPKLLSVVGGGAPQGAPAGGPASTGPVSQGMTTPQPNEGAQAQASVNVTMALDLLEKALPAFGAESEHGAAILKALSTLSKPFGAKRQQSQGLVAPELRAMMEQLGMKSPEQQALAGGGGQPGQPPMQQAA